MNAIAKTALVGAGLMLAAPVLLGVVVIGGIVYLWSRIPSGDGEPIKLELIPSALLNAGKTGSESAHACKPISAGYDQDPSKGPVILPGAIYDGPELARDQDRQSAAALELGEMDTGTLWPATLEGLWANLNAALARAGITGPQLQLWFLRAVRSGDVCLPGTIVAWSETSSSATKAAKGAANKFDQERAVRLARNRIRSYRAALILWDQAGRPALS